MRTSSFAEAERLSFLRKNRTGFPQVVKPGARN